jgi:hypothetical protein
MSRPKLPWARRPEVIADTGIAAQYEAAMFRVRTAVAELETALSRGDFPEANLRALRRRVDRDLATAVAAASQVYSQLFDAAGGMRHAEVHPEVALWKRRLNVALTLRNQHQLAEMTEPGGLPPAVARVRTRAAYGPHQAGLDYADDPGAGSAAGPARPMTGLDLDMILERSQRDS